MTAGEYCNREVIIVEPTISVTEAAALMRRHHVGDLVVVEKEGEEARPIGIITDRDIVIEVVAQKIDPDSLTVKDIMSTDPLRVAETVSLLDTLELMKQHGVRRVLVIADSGGLQGLLSADDAIELIAEQINDLTQLVDREITREQKQHP
jgi:CBS domain-containing protein